MSVKSQFITYLSADHLEGKWWRIRLPLVFYSAQFNKTYTCPPRAVVDFASIPRLPISYLFFGNTMHWEAALHDVPGYRFGVISREEADAIFNEAGKVRGILREDQRAIFRFGRALRRIIATSAVRVAGGSSYKVNPGSLDYRVCEKCELARAFCTRCSNYYPLWDQCVVEGYRPDMEIKHSGGIQV